MTLEQILQEYFSCKKPFDGNGKLTKQGDRKVQQLINLLHDLAFIGVIPDASNSERIIDEIIDQGY